MLFAATFLSALTFLGASASPLPELALEARAVVNHDSLGPIWPRTQGGVVGNAMDRFSPFLHIAHGCQPHTAVNDNGDVSGGLQDTGNPSAGCRNIWKGQTYVRAAWHRGRFGIMYAWYFPKDQPNAGNVAGGHRHDWENTVVWITNPAVNPRIVGVATSGHGSYGKTRNPPREGDRVKVEYFTRFPMNHALQVSNAKGSTYWLSQWETMPNAAKHALATHNWGKANVPFTDANFRNNLEKAFI